MVESGDQAPSRNRLRCRSQLVIRFQLPLFWSTISKSLISTDSNPRPPYRSNRWPALQCPFQLFRIKASEGRRRRPNDSAEGRMSSPALFGADPRPADSRTVVLPISLLYSLRPTWRSNPVALFMVSTLGRSICSSTVPLVRSALQSPPGSAIGACFRARGCSMPAVEQPDLLALPAARYDAILCRGVLNDRTRIGVCCVCGGASPPRRPDTGRSRMGSDEGP